MKTTEKKSKTLISAKELTEKGYAVCLFPEQPRKPVPESQDRSRKSSLKKVRATSPTGSQVQLVRLHWRNRLIYIVALISFTLSLNNIYHFPVNVYRYGLIFFLPYTLLTVAVGYPLHVLQTSIGQYSQRGSLWVWKCAPLCFGVGVAMLLNCALASLYHNMFAAYSLVYFSHCFSKVLPWTYCNGAKWEEKEFCAPPTWHYSENYTLPSKVYFYNVILNTPNKYPSESMEMKNLKWWLFISLMFSWFLVYVATLRSIRSIGKVVTIIVIFSYFAILVLLMIAIQINHSHRISFSIDVDSVFDVEMWCSAVIQVIIELGVCHGIPLVYGSYCHFRNRPHIDSFILCCVNYLNSFIFFYIFFAFLKSVSCFPREVPSHLSDNSISLVYILYSEAFVSLPQSNLWCLIFFLMLFLIIIGTQIAFAEAIMAGVYDTFHKLSTFRWIINLLICGFFCFIGSIFCFSNGYFRILLFYHIPLHFISIPITCLFVIGIIIIYGLKQYSENIKQMCKLDHLFQSFWYILIGLLVFTFIVSLIFIQSKIYYDGMDYNELQTGKGFLIACFVIFPTLLCAIFWTFYSLCSQKPVLEPLDSWKQIQESRDEISDIYSKSYLWEWNKY